MPNRRSAVAVTGAAALLALVVAACGGTAATVTPASAPPVATAAPAGSPTSAATEAAPSSQAPASSAPSDEAGGRTGRIELPSDGIALTLPDGWTEVVLSGEDVDSILSAFPEGTFTEEQQAMMRQAVTSGLSLMAFDGDASGSNVNLLTQDQAVPMSLLAPALPAQLATIPGASNIDVREAQSLGEDALIATYDLQNTLADGTVSNMTGTQLYVSANDRLYILTVTLAADSGTDPMTIIGSIEDLE